nr:uncharacterized protein LOC110072694 [Pogona vitticeps]
MTLLALVMFLLTWGLTGTGGSLLELAQMIKDVTGKNAVPHYSSYGCYCGLGGKGTPLDETDRCCYDHDRCYDRVDAEGCDSKATFYHYSVHSGKVKCGGGEWWRKRIFGHQPPCEGEICECDKRLVLCLKKHVKSYRAAYRFYPNFLCFGPMHSYQEMKIHWGLMVLLIYVGVLKANGGILEFGDMILKLTGKTSFPYYTGYGCYCGLGGKGKPRDATDRCCFAHDCCYEKLKDCHTTTERYDYTIEGGNITCGNGSHCETQLCECDKTAAVCFRDNLDSYNNKYIFYLDVYCTEETSPC